jgi:hypothetical protein
LHGIGKGGKSCGKLQLVFDFCEQLVEQPLPVAALQGRNCLAGTAAPGAIQWPQTSYIENRGTNRYNNNWAANGIAYYQGCDGGVNR